MKILLLLGLLIFVIGSVSALYAEDANTPADPNAIVDPNGVNDPNIVVPE
ncbi:MAG: hypothetical protein WC770_06235 [Phycisphaerae bacterium]|jgi:hypothetical protein